MIQVLSCASYGSDLLGPRFRCCPTLPVPLLHPFCKVAEPLVQLDSFSGQGILDPWRRLRVDLSLDYLSMVKLCQAFGKAGCAYPRYSPFQVIEPCWLFQPEGMYDRQGPDFGQVVPGGV